LQKLSDELQRQFQTVPFASEILAQLLRVAKSFALAQSKLQTDVQLLGLLNQLATKLAAQSKQFQNLQAFGGCFRDLQASLKVI
ncbi:hypothetical protein Q6247_26510, partial [Klebsiella pneumoniae]